MRTGKKDECNDRERGWRREERKEGGMDRMEGRREGKKGTEKNKGNRKFRKHQVPK